RLKATSGTSSTSHLGWKRVLFTRPTPLRWRRLMGADRVAAKAETTKNKSQGDSGVRSKFLLEPSGLTAYPPVLSPLRPNPESECPYRLSSDGSGRTPSS